MRWEQVVAEVVDKLLDSGICPSDIDNVRTPLRVEPEVLEGDLGPVASMAPSGGVRCEGCGGAASSTIGVWLYPAATTAARSPTQVAHAVEAHTAALRAFQIMAAYAGKKVTR